MSPEQLTEIMERNSEHFRKLKDYEAEGTAMAPLVRDLRTLSIEVFRLQTELMSLRGDMLYNKAHEPHVYASRIEKMLEKQDFSVHDAMSQRAEGTGGLKNQWHTE
jgi:hypothetical protein